MDSFEKKTINILKDLKENHNVIGVKAEFESEGSSYEEALKLKEIATNAGLNLTIKIGGCEAIKDMIDAQTIGASTIIAPMIETSYAMKKYINAIHYVFSEEDRKKHKFLINIETITGFNNFNNIITSENFNEIDGIVLGRGDMTASMGLSKDNINSTPILNIAKIISETLMTTNKDYIIGGGVSDLSIPFFKQLPYLKKFETRKVIFDATKSLLDINANKGILKALAFELLWLKNKQNFSGKIYKGDEIRLQNLERKYKSLIEEIGGIYKI